MSQVLAETFEDLDEFVENLVTEDDAPADNLFTLGVIPRQLAAALYSVNERVHSQESQRFGFDVSHRLPVEIPPNRFVSKR